MRYDNSCEKLGLTGKEPSEITIDVLKRHYKMKALQYHPDKNREPNAAAKFQEIHDAYEYLMKYQGFYKKDNNNIDEENDQGNDRKSGYQWVLMSFLKNILKEETRSSLYYTILNRIASTCEKTALETLSKLEKTTLFKTYEILIKYKESLHFSDAFISSIEELIKEKIKGDECIILNPTIDDLIENNLYKLTINDKIYIIPLWHHELIYDLSCNDLIVNCNPILPENIEIDENNNLHMRVTFNITDIWNKPFIDISIGRHIFSVPPSTFKLIEKQIILFPKQGISKMNSQDIYDVSKKTDIYLNITLKM
jgi:curved DNA-binding protein CbpA